MDVFDILQAAVDSRIDHRAGERKRHAVADSVLSACPSGIDEIDVAVVFFDAFAEKLRVAHCRKRQERRREAGAEGRLRFRDTAFCSGKLARVAGNEMVHRLVLAELRDRRQNAESVCCQEDHRRRLSADARDNRVGDIVERIADTRVFRVTAVAVIRCSFFVVDDVFDNGAGLDRVPDFRFAFTGQVDAFRVAAAFEVEDTVGAPAVFVIADQTSLRIGGESGLAGVSVSLLDAAGSPVFYDDGTPVTAKVTSLSGAYSFTGLRPGDYKVKFDDQIFDCVDFGFKPNEKVDVVLRPEDIDIVPLEQGKITGEVLSVLFKGVWNEAMVETVPGTTVKVNMNVIKNHDVESEYSDERISANDFYVDIEEVASLDDNDLIARADAQAWKESDDSYISISKIEHNLKEELGEYTVTFQTSSGLSVSRKIIVVDQKYVKNERKI